MQVLEKLWKMTDDRDIKRVTTEKRSKLSQNKICHRKCISNRNEEKTKQNNKNKKTETLSNKAVNLGLLMIELSKILMYEFWYDYVKRKYDEKAKLCYMDTGSSLHT